MYDATTVEMKLAYLVILDDTSYHIIKQILSRKIKDVSKTDFCYDFFFEKKKFKFFYQVDN